MRIVVKVGTNVLRAGTDGIHRPRLIELARQMACLCRENHELILVSSGAIFAGRELLQIGPSPARKDIPYKQMLAAVGQGRLMALYQQIFEMYHLSVAQALLTRADLANRTRYLNARNTLELLLQHGVIPIINENDVVAVEEIKFGDNDNLSGLVANLIDADLLVILTDQAGLFTADPRRCAEAKLVQKVVSIDATVREMAADSSNGIGTGGMITKIEAAKLATQSGTEVVIAPGYEPDSILRVVNGDRLGTRFPTQTDYIEGRKRWILAETARGAITIDDGAVKAITRSGKSLLVAGVTGVSGDFQRGVAIDVLELGGRKIGRGLANYNACDLQAIKGKQSSQIAQSLGYEYGPTAVHRNNLVIV